MEGGTEQDYYEFEMLLGEIPSVTSGNPRVQESVPMNSLSDFEGRRQEQKSMNSSSPTTFTNFYHASQAGSPRNNAVLYNNFPLQGSNATSVNSSDGPFNQKAQANGNLDGGKIAIENGYKSPLGSPNHKDSNLHDDQSLASAFTQLSFNERMTAGAMSPQPVNYSPPPKCTSLFEENYSRKPHSTLDPGSIGRASTQSLNTLNSTTLMNSMVNGVQKFDMGLISQENEKFLIVDVQEPKTNKNWSFQPIGNLSGVLGEQQQYLPLYSSAAPLAPTMHPYQVLPSFPVPGVEFPVAPYQQQYFFDPQSRLPYMQTQQINRSHIPWQHIEEEQYNRMPQQYQYMQQLRDERPEAYSPIQPNRNMTVEPMSRVSRQPCFEMPNPYQVEQLSKDPFWNNASLEREFNPSELTLMGSGQCRYHAQGICRRGQNCSFTHGHKQTSLSSFCKSPHSSTDFEPVKHMEKVGRNSFPEKILTRSHGLNFLKAINPISMLGNESLNHLNGNDKVISNNHFHHKPSLLHVASLKLDGGSSRCSSSDSSDFNTNNLISQPQKYTSMDEVMGKICLIAKDQHGCRFLQRKFTEGSAEDVEKIFVEIIGYILELMIDPFGNYLVQKLLEVCNEDQRMQILHAITRKPGDLVRISLDMHGTRAVQKVIETLKTPEQYSMVVSSLKPGIVTLMKDTNGNHVAQRCLQNLMPEYNEFLFEAAIAHCNKLAKDRHGCCVLQKCLSRCDGEHRRRLVCAVTSSAFILSQNQYGNYVVQYIFELQLPWATIDVLEKLKGSFGLLSTQKYSSNVVEKCLKYAGEERRPRIIEELIGDSWLDQILHDPYGNYVIQAALNYSKGASQAALVEAIKPHVQALRTSPYGKKILSSNSLRK